ncbi:MAG: hypothetical protein OQL06_01585 [Gammaproteobacteria bacterium]|nr:hypothetical protein [Gammaproteobacteria bacterium]
MLPAIKNKNIKFADGIELQNGDRFRGQIRTENLILDKQNSFQLESIHLPDIESRMDDELIMAQMTSNNGDIRRFEIVAKSIVIDTAYGEPGYPRLLSECPGI